MTRALLALLCAFPLLLGAACGGGGGGGGSTPPPCTKPGTLTALALQGQPAPGTAGNFGPLPAGMLMDVGRGGWAVFVAPTTDPLRAVCLFVAQPNGTLLNVFHKGEVVPNAGGGTINGFQIARVNAAGQILAEVSIVGDAGARTFGLLTAQVVGGAVINKASLAYDQDDMAVTGVNGALSDIDEARVWFLEDGRTFFGGTTSDPAEALWIVNLDGSGLDGLIATGDALPDVGNPNVTCLDIAAVGTAPDGGRFVFVANVGGPFEDRLYIGTVAGSAIAEIASDGNALPLGGFVTEIYGGGPLLLTNDGFVVWKAQGSEGVPDDAILRGTAISPYALLARSGFIAPQASGGVWGELDLLNHRGDNDRPQMASELIGVPNGADFGCYIFAAPTLLTIFEGLAAPADYGHVTTFSDQLPGLRAAQTFDVATDDSFAFAAKMQDDTSGMFWGIPNCGTFTLAASGQTIPGGGDTFGAFSPQATHTTHDGVVLFRALLTTAGSGLFRQAP